MSDDGTVAWGALLAGAAERVDPEDARRIVEEVAGVAPGGLHRVLDELVTQRGVARFDAMVQRRVEGEPLQYVLGRWGFRTLDLMVDHRALIPRPETEVVAGFAIDEVKHRLDNGRDDVTLADLGTGTGAVGLAVAVECDRVRVLATDASADALSVARANLSGIGRAATRVSLHQGDWFEALPTAVAGTLDVIVSNPPYVADDEPLPPVVADWEPRSALRGGPLGLRDLRLIVEGAPLWLRLDGVLVLEMAPDQSDIVAQWCRGLGFETEVRRDLAGRDRAVVAHREQTR